MGYINKVQSFSFSPALNPGTSGLLLGEAWCNLPGVEIQHNSKRDMELWVFVWTEAWVDQPGNPTTVHSTAFKDSGFKWQTTALQTWIVWGHLVFICVCILVCISPTLTCKIRSPSSGASPVLHGWVRCHGDDDEDDDDCGLGRRRRANKFHNPGP